MNRPILAEWSFTSANGTIKDSELLSSVQKNGTIDCRSMGLSVKGKLREDSVYDTMGNRPHNIMALKSSELGTIAIMDTYTEIILA